MSHLGQWICTKCCRDMKLRSLSIRMRFGSEACPKCQTPGAGMEYVTRQRMEWDLSDVTP